MPPKCCLGLSALHSAGRAGLGRAGPVACLLSFYRSTWHLLDPVPEAQQPLRGCGLSQPLLGAPSWQLSPLVEGAFVFHCPSRPILPLVKFPFPLKSPLYRELVTCEGALASICGSAEMSSPLGPTGARCATVPGDRAAIRRCHFCLLCPK